MRMPYVSRHIHRHLVTTMPTITQRQCLCRVSRQRRLYNEVSVLRKNNVTYLVCRERLCFRVHLQSSCAAETTGAVVP